MDGNGKEESDATSSSVKDHHEGLDAVALEQDKKQLFWMEGVMNCFSTVLSLFNRDDLKPQKDNDWVVPFESITNLVYLGSGAQGDVYWGNLNGVMVAVKKLRDESEVNIKHLRKLNHDNIVHFCGVCTEPPIYCVIMEYCQYGPLFEFLHSGVCFGPKQILKWAKEIAHGMAYLHSHKIIHRDLKSPNILIADNLTSKVSDFGTSREWNDVSAIMSFTGTVAWMAPEVIRHEPCSERVDVWSYGVVLWELLTQEVPYKNLETHAIMWGVGTNTISLPIPSTCPESLNLLLNQCWNRVSRNRPPFKIILAHLEIAGDQFVSIPADSFSATQSSWRKEVQAGMNNYSARTEQPQTQEAIMLRREELKHARDIRKVYEQQLIRANELYMEACALRLQLEQREKSIVEREKALRACRCGLRRISKFHQRQTSSSSDGVKALACVNAFDEICQRRRNKKKTEQAQAQVVVNYTEKTSNDPQTVVMKVTNDFPCLCTDDCTQNNNLVVSVKNDTVIENNGNIDMKDTVVKYHEKNLIDNYIQNVAQV